MSGRNPVVSVMNQAMDRLALELDEHLTSPGSWFDGFWDFFVENRARIEEGPSWQIAGMSSFSWAILAIAARPAAHPAAAEVHVFVEARDYRPGIHAPWPVSGKRDGLNRPHDKERAEAIRRLGFEPRVGYWGVACTWHTPTEATEDIAETVRLALADVPKVLHLAVDLAEAI